MGGFQASLYKSSEVKISVPCKDERQRLWGAYNHNITQKVLEHIEAGGKNAEIIAIGQKGYEFLVAGTLI